MARRIRDWAQYDVREDLSLVSSKGRPPQIRLYHRTPAAQQILVDAFRDGADTYGLGTVHKGVWFSDSPVPRHLEPGALLGVELPEEVAAQYEILRDAHFYRQWKWREYLIPARIANAYPRMPIDEADGPE